ncbi:MAG: valine--tRNA ligase [Acidobacteriota bacterium]|nr:valine--tRNA ligase [Acidobacteriota bacterium]
MPEETASTPSSSNVSEIGATEASAGPLPKAYDPSAIERRWAEFWVRERLFDVRTPGPGQSAPSDAFTLLLPPPNVTGRLHMGHMLNQTEMDILTRWHRMLGDTALWVPGTDHAGIATQMMVERQLAGEGTHRKALGREAFTTRVWQWKSQYGNAITEQMKRLGASVDWSREYFTMDARLSVAVREAFVRLWEQGLIYRGAYIVNWDPVQQTAVSDLEVESEERMGKLYSIRYPFAGAGGPYDETNSIVIATTRPETMLGDVAVAVNPDDDRYRHRIGTKLTLPLSGVSGGANREIPLIADNWARPEFGTGAVKVTPAHDPNDFAIGQRHGLASLTILDETARVLLPGSPYHGLDRFAARERMVADLGSAGLLVAVKDHAMTVPVSQRSGAVIEPRLSMQWFLAVNKPVPDRGSGGTRGSIAQTAIDAVREGHIRFTPEMYAKTYFEWMGNIHDWCLSRQLWWGHRIPAWHCSACGEITVSRGTPSACSACGGAEIRQETDVLDTWFSSGLLPFTVFGWPGDDGGATPDLDAFYPTSLLVTGFDILFFWVARMIMLGCHFMLDVPVAAEGGLTRPRELGEAVPFKDVYIHALVRDANREKMSKTKGNVIDPIQIVEQYGTDAVRFTLASQASPGTDIAFNEARTEGYRAFANKIWNAARFLFMNMDRAREAGIIVGSSARSESDGALESRWIMAGLSETCGAIDASLRQHRFDEAASHIYQFFWGDLCDWYLEMVKLRLVFDDAARRTQTAASLQTLVEVFESALRLLSPFMPFLTEEIWHALYAGHPPARSIALAAYPQAADYPRDKESVAAVETLQELITTIRGLRKEIGVPEKEPAPVRIYSAGAAAKLAETHADMLAKLCRVSAVEIASATLNGSGARSTPSFDVQVLYERQIDVPAERERLSKELLRLNKVLTANEGRLGDAAFLGKAPPHIVEGLRRQTEDTRGLRDKTQAALDDLRGA